MTSAARRPAIMNMKNLPPPPPPPSGGEGIRIMYDEDLSTKLHFKEEVGAYNPPCTLPCSWTALTDWLWQLGQCLALHAILQTNQQLILFYH